MKLTFLERCCILFLILKHSLNASDHSLQVNYNHSSTDTAGVSCQIPLDLVHAVIPCFAPGCKATHQPHKTNRTNPALIVADLTPCPTIYSSVCMLLVAVPLREKSSWLAGPVTDP
jgi:hypothetical protein